MTLLGSETLNQIRSGQLTLGFGVQNLRGAAVPLLAKAAGYDWLFIDAEHGSISTQEISQICLAALSAGVAPIVRVCHDALHEGARALDNGALGLIIPHVNTPTEAKRLIEAFRFHPLGRRSMGGSTAQFGFRPPPASEMQRILNEKILLIPMIETPEAVGSVDEIIGIEGIDGILVGTSDLTLEMGIPGQIGHEKVQTAYHRIAEACRRHNKIFGMGGVYDREWAPRYIAMGARMILAAGDQAFLIEAATNRANFLRNLPFA
jgi:2-keto-3-deoxy-L-rhamnonate aldolase RhmA